MKRASLPIAAALALCAALALASREPPRRVRFSGSAAIAAAPAPDAPNPARGAAAIAKRGCGSCHSIPGVRGAEGLVGPPLDNIGARFYVAGVLVNTPENLERWIMNPPGVDPMTAMPNLRLGRAEARDIAAYLTTLK